MNTVLITGANRGIGLEFCTQYADQDWTVLACCRHPQQADQLNELAAGKPNIQVSALDVLDHAGIDRLAARLNGSSIDLLIANAGIYGDSRGKELGHLDYPAWIRTLETNVLGVVKVVEAFLPNLRRSSKPMLAALSSQMGSIADNSSGGSILYRSSKAALNATLKSVSIDLYAEGIGVLIFHPGWVKTDMGGPHALIDTNTSVSGMIKQINGFTMDQTGQFIKYDGSRLPW